MDTNRNGIYGSGVHVPSGTEVEAATLHVPVGDGCAVHAPGHSHMHDTLPERSGMREKLDTLKSQSLSKVEAMKSNVNRSMELMKSNVTRSVETMKSNVTRSVSTAKSSLRDGTSHTISDLQTSMRSSPMKWAGIAAGTGFGLGLLGRVLHWRSSHQRTMPSLIVIERSC